jgi:hypothetical protein
MSHDVELPSIVTWQKRYCLFMAATYVLCIGMGVFMLVFRNEAADARHPTDELVVTGVVLIGLGGVLALAYGAAPFIRPAPWVWTYHLVLIAFGLTSACCLPICIPLLIGWIKPETKRYYGRPSP